MNSYKNRLTPVYEAGQRLKADGTKAEKLWYFSCSCGGWTITTYRNWKSGNSKSCGCIKKENPPYKTHGDTKTHYLYSAWQNAKNRCFNPSDKHFKDYGGRGITMFDSWVTNYVAFREWVTTALGQRPKGYSLDRINNDGNYEPNNLRWASSFEQARNRRKRQKRLTI